MRLLDSAHRELWAVMVGVNHQEAQEICQREAPEHWMINSHVPGTGSHGEIPFEIARGRFQASQERSGRGRRVAWLKELWGLEWAFTEVTALQERRETEPAGEQLLVPRLSRSGKGSMEHANGTARAASTNALTARRLEPITA